MLLTIHDFQFELSEPFKAGQPISAAEARVLNGARANRIRKTIERETGKGESAGKRVSRIEKRIQELERDFEFTERSERAKLETELMAFAREIAKERRRSERDPEVLNEAERRLELQRETARVELDALLGGC